MIPTRFTSIKVSPQCNPKMVAYWVDSDVACNDGVQELVTHNCVLITIAIKYLGIDTHSLSRLCKGKHIITQSL